jgi:hypothetical protein
MKLFPLLIPFKRFPFMAPFTASPNPFPYYVKSIIAVFPLELPVLMKLPFD